MKKFCINEQDIASKDSNKIIFIRIGDNKSSVTVNEIERIANAINLLKKNSFIITSHNLQIESLN